MKTKAITAIMATMLLIGVAFYALPVKAAGVLKIGVIGPAGWPQMDGMKRGAELAKDWINGPGGGIVIDGERFDVDLYFANEHAVDMRPDLAQAEMLDLLTVKKVDLVFGGFRTECTYPMREAAMNLKTIMYICGAATNELIDCGYPARRVTPCGACVRCNYDKYKYVFRITPINVTMLIYSIQGFLKDYVIPQRLVPLYGSPIKVAVLTEDLDWSVGLYNAFTILTSQYLGDQVQVVYKARTPYPTTDFSSYIAAMHAAKVRLIVHIYSAPDSIALVSQMKASPLKAIACGIDVLGQAAENWALTGGGCEYTAFTVSTGTRSPVSLNSTPYTTAQVWDNCWAKYNSAPIYTMWGVYDGIISTHDTLENVTGQLTEWIKPPFNQNADGKSDQLVDIVKLTDRTGVLGRFKYTTYHDPMSNEYGSTWTLGYIRALWAQWQSGRLEVVWPADRPYSKRWCLPNKMYNYPTDVNEDAKRDTEDISAIGYAFGSYPAAQDAVPHPRWQHATDWNDDDKIDGSDHAAVSYDFGKTVTTPIPY